MMSPKYIETWTNRAAHDSYFEGIPFKENVPI